MSCGAGFNEKKPFISSAMHIYVYMQNNLMQILKRIEGNIKKVGRKNILKR